MNTFYSNVAGLEVHLKTIEVAVPCRQPTGKLVGHNRIGFQNQCIRLPVGHALTR